MCRVYANLYSDDGARDYIYPPAVVEVERWLEDNGLREVSVFVTDTTIEISHVLNDKLIETTISVDEWDDITIDELKQ